MDLGELNWSVRADTSDLERAERHFESTRDAAEGTRRGVESVGTGATKASRETRTATQRMERSMQSTRRATDMLRNAVSGLVGVLGVREIIRFADAWQNAENQLRIVTRSAQQLADVQQRLVDVAIETRSNFSSTANLYARLARSTTELGLSQQNLIDLTTTINRSFAVSGATAEEASAAITQLSQGLASGALRGDEFNSVSEQAPGIMRAVAESLRMGIGELRDFAATGGITAEIVVNALQEASDTIANDFAGSVATFGQQMEVARTQLTQWAGENSNIRSAVSGVGNAIVGLTGGLNNHSDAVNAVTGALVGAASAYYAYSIAAGVAQKATVLFSRALKVNPLIAAATAITAIGGAMYAARDASIQFGDTQGTLAQWMQGTWTTLSNLFETQFSGAVDTAAAAFGPFGETAGQVAGYVWNTFKALLGNILDAAKMTANGTIAYFLTIRDTMGIVARTIRDQFASAFDNTLNIAAAFWGGVKSIFSGSIDFSGFRAAVAEGIIDPLADAGGEIARSFADNFSADYLGDSIQFFSEEIESFGEAVSRNVRIANTEFKTLDGWLLSVAESSDRIKPVDPDAAKAAKKLADQFESLKKSLDPSYAALTEFWEGVELLNKAIDTSTEGGMKEYNRLIGLLTERFVEAKEAARDYSTELDSLLNRLDPVRARTQAYAQGVNILAIAMASGKISINDYAQAMIGLQEEFYNIDDATDDATREIERFGNAVDDVFVDAFKGAFDSFESFADRLSNAFETLMAELAYAAVKNEIKIRLGMETSGPNSGGISDLFNTRGSSGLGSVINAGKSLLGFGGGSSAAAGGLYAGANTGAVAGTLYGSANTGAAVGGLYGSAATGGVASTGIMSSIASGVSAAMPWIAGGLAIDNILGLGITDSIAGAFDSLFGSSRKSYGQIGSELNPDRDDENGVYRYVRDGNSQNYAQQSALGTIGITRKQKTDDAALLEMVAAFAEIDNTLASVMTSAQLENTREALDGWESSKTKNIGNIVDERLSAVLDATGSMFKEELSQFEGEALVQGMVGALQVENVGAEMAAAVADDMNAAFREALASGSGVEAATQTILSSAQAVQLLGDSVGRLNLQFDDTSSGALAAAGSLAQMAGGVDQLASLQSSYYQAFFTDAERTANLQDDLATSLRAVGLELPATRDGFRALVEAQDLNTESGQQNYATLLQLAGGFDQLQTMLSNTGAVVEEVSGRMSRATDSTDRFMAAFERSIEAEQDRMQSAHDARMDRYRDEINATTDSIRELETFVSSLENAMQSVRVQSDALDYSRLQTARGVIDSAARSGVTQTSPELENALSIAGQDSQQYYSTFSDYARDQAKTAIDIESLYDNSKAELTVEQRMLESLELQQQRAQSRHEEAMTRLDRQVEQYQQQIDAILGVDNSVQSVAGAVAALEGAIKGLKVAQEQAGGGSGGAQSEIDRIYQGSLGREADAAGEAYWESTGLTGKALQDAIEYSAWADGDLPGFANGGTHSGGWRMVGERGPEIEYTGPSRITSNNDIMSLNDELTNEVKQLREDLRQVMRPIAENTGRSADTLEGWEYNGQPPVREGVDA